VRFLDGQAATRVNKPKTHSTDSGGNRHGQAVEPELRQTCVGSTSSSKTVTLGNTGKATLSIAGIAVTAGFYPDQRTRRIRSIKEKLRDFGPLQTDGQGLR
jgi:hypothetical protein